MSEEAKECETPVAPVKLFFDIHDLAKLVTAEVLKVNGAAPSVISWRAGVRTLECIVMLGGTDAEQDTWIASLPECLRMKVGP